MLPSRSHKTAIWKEKLRTGIILVLGVLALLAITPQISDENAIAKDFSTTTEITISSSEKINSNFLMLGDHSSEVKTLKTNLKDLGYETISQTSGLFDEATDRAVRKFQQSERLSVDGIVGPITQERIAAVVGSRSRNGTQVENIKARTQPRKLTANLSNATLPPDIQRIVDRGVLVVSLLDKDNPPFFMVREDGQLDGSDVKMARAIAEALDVDVEFRRTATTFNEVVDDVYARNADLAISKISRTLKRARHNRFSKPYLSLRQGLLVNRLQLAQSSHGSNMTEMIRNLEGKIGIIKGSSYAGFAKQKFPKATIVSYPNWSDVVKAVTNGTVVAAYRDELEVKKIVLSRPDTALQLQTIALTDTQDPLSIVLPWDSNHLLAFVNQYLDTADLIDTTDELLEEYIAYFQPN